MSIVVGSGVIANRFIDYQLQQNGKYLIFAGNVNDSTIKNISIIDEEEAIISAELATLRDRCFVYFSSCSILDPVVSHSPYVLHKARMEKLVQDSAKNFLIFRLPQIIALSDTSSSLVNFIVNSIINQEKFELWQNSWRNLIDIDDVHEIVGLVLRRELFSKKIINIASSHQTSVLQLVRDIEDFLGLTANYTLSNLGASYEIDVSEIKPILTELEIDFGGDYIKKSLRKYFSHLQSGPKLLSVIIPTYNEEQGIDEFYRRTKRVLSGLAPRFEHELIFVNDSSTDKTFIKLVRLAETDATVKVIDFSRNFGNQIAITAGVDFARGCLAIVIDDDLQDPPEVILNLIAKWDYGFKVVYGVRPNRKGVNFLFKLIARLYYRVIASLSDTKIPNDTGDFRLIDRVVIDTLKKMKEENRYYRGMVSWVGFSQIGVEYERDKRYAGVSTFSFKKYINFALNGLTSFTEKPLYFSCVFGLIITSITFIIAIILIVQKLLNPASITQGWTSLTVIILFFGGIQLLSTGILGVYVSKIYREVKGRPLYIVASTINIQPKIDEK